MTTTERENAATVIQGALKDLRPYLEADGGDISLEEITKEGVVFVRLHGACSTCSMSEMTMKAGVEEAIKRAVPKIKEVKAIRSEAFA